MARALEVKIIGDPSSVKRAFGEIEQAGGKLHSFLSGAFKVGVAGAAAGLTAFGVAAKIGWDDFNDGAKNAAQTEAVIKSTGQAAHVTAKQVNDLAGAIQEKSGIDDDAVQSGENMLLTFTNIRNEVGKGNDIFNQSTSILSDMSVALGTDMKDQAIQLGKALNDPIAGISALSRVGVTFTDSQKEVVKHLVETGHTVDAQKLILHELNKEFGGSAEAAGKTLPGQLAILRGEFSNFAGDMVAKAIPAITSFVSMARDHMPEVKAVLSDAFSRIGEVFQQVWPTLKLQVEATWVFFRDNLLPIIKQLGDIFVTTVQNIAGVVQEHMPEIRRILDTVGSVIKEVAKVAIPLLKFALEVVLPTAIGIAITAIDKILGVLRGIGDGIKDVIGWFRDLPHNIAGAINDGIGVVKKAITGLFGKVIDWVKETLGIKSPSVVFYDIGVNMIKGFIGGIGSMAGALAHKVKDLVTGFLPHLSAPTGSGLVSGSGGLVGHVLNALNYARQMGWRGSVISGFRTYAEQAALYQRYLAGGPIAAKPGTSSHERGEAVDVSDASTFDSIMAGAPPGIALYNNVPGDFNHFSISGHAAGGIINQPLHLFGEAGPEAVIPLGKWMDGWQQVKEVTQDGWTQVKTTTADTLRRSSGHHDATRELLTKILAAVSPLNGTLKEILSAVSKSGFGGSSGSSSTGASRASSAGGGAEGGADQFTQIHPENGGFVQVFPQSSGGSFGFTKEAAGGAGRVTGPTLFLAGEAGDEDFAFSGANRRFGGGGGGDFHVHLHVGSDVRDPERLVRDIEEPLRRFFYRYQRSGGQLVVT
jgi:hypothetical protein